MAAGARQAFPDRGTDRGRAGAGLPIGEDSRQYWWLTSAAGRTEVAVMSMSGVVVSRSLRVAGDERIWISFIYVRNKYNLLIGESIAEQIKWKIGRRILCRQKKQWTARAAPGHGALPRNDPGVVGGNGRGAFRLGAGDRGYRSATRWMKSRPRSRRLDGCRYLALAGGCAARSCKVWRTAAVR